MAFGRGALDETGRLPNHGPAFCPLVSAKSRLGPFCPITGGALMQPSAKITAGASAGRYRSHRPMREKLIADSEGAWYIGQGRILKGLAAGHKWVGADYRGQAVRLTMHEPRWCTADPYLSPAHPGDRGNVIAGADPNTVPKSNASPSSPNSPIFDFFRSPKGKPSQVHGV
ncbi:hypothetical protein KM043_000658 [Ampulex compressa]|nr:hypothetical protein KM043_000658 [Ampulex compressa]